jgi:hypothetical protein
MRVEKAENKEEKQEEHKGQVIEVTETVRIPDTKIILEKGDKIEIFPSEKKEESVEEEQKLKEASEVNFNVSFMGVDGSFTVTKGMDYVYDVGAEEPKEVEKVMLNGSIDVNLECGSMPEVSALETAVKDFANKFAKEKVE